MNGPSDEQPLGLGLHADISGKMKKTLTEMGEAYRLDRYKTIIDSMGLGYGLHTSQSPYDNYLSGSGITELADIHEIEVYKEEINTLRKTVQRQFEELANSQAFATKKSQDEGSLREKINELEQKERSFQFFSRIRREGIENITKGGILEEEFQKDVIRDSFILSVDIRRSTQLMLKSKSPDLFAKFITTLCEKMRMAAVKNFGVFDKFTGDGILAFFPDFYSGQDAGLLCLDTAKSCHEIFNAVYKEHRHCFTSVLLDVGLGIGVDHGLVKIEKVGMDITVVGVPVVYACRLGGARAGNTLVNQPAFETFSKFYADRIKFTEDSLLVKDEGNMLAYRAEIFGTVNARQPHWMASSEKSNGTSPAEEKKT